MGGSAETLANSASTRVVVSSQACVVGEPVLSAVLTASAAFWTSVRLKVGTSYIAWGSGRIEGTTVTGRSGRTGLLGKVLGRCGAGSVLGLGWVWYGSPNVSGASGPPSSVRLARGTTLRVHCHTEVSTQRRPSHALGGQSRGVHF